MPNTQVLIDALKSGKMLVYLQPGDEPDKQCYIEPYKSDHRIEGGLDFSFYGWGSAFWRISNVYEYICLFPERFKINEITVQSVGEPVLPSLPDEETVS
jgi:hypothetical protein